MYFGTERLLPWRHIIIAWGDRSATITVGKKEQRARFPLLEQKKDMLGEYRNQHPTLHQSQVTGG
jgi:hypothetical protein